MAGDTGLVVRIILHIWMDQQYVVAQHRDACPR